jgi:hypothetical protein
MALGTLALGRITLQEGYTVQKTIDGGGTTTITVSGQETWPSGLRTYADVKARADDLLSLQGKILPFDFQYKTELDGYYIVTGVDTNRLNWPAEAGQASWTVTANFVGPDNGTDLESRLANVIRANDFALTGTRWHCPPVGHYAYYTGSTSPSGSVVRVGAAGSETVYLGIPAAAAPRWGCAVGAYGAGRTRLIVDNVERSGTGIQVGAWILDNSLLRVSPLSSGGQLLVESYDGTQWEGKAWHIAKGGATTSLGTIDQWTVVKNDTEMIVIRGMRNASPGRTLVDLTLRRGSRFVEVYLQTDTSTTLGAYLNTTEGFTNGTGVNVATSNDAAGNKAAIGSARSYTANANGGLSKAAVVKMDLWIGSVVGGTGAISGDAANDLRDQYIGALSETIWAVKR